MLLSIHLRDSTPIHPINKLLLHFTLLTLYTLGVVFSLTLLGKFETWTCMILLWPQYNVIRYYISMNKYICGMESLNKEFKTPWKIVFNENWRIDRLPQRFMGGVTWVGCVPASSPGGGWCVRRCPPWSSGTWGGAAWGQQGGGCSDAEISENKLVEQAELAVIVKRKRLHSKQNNQALCTLKHIQLKIYTEWLIEDFNILWRGKY